MTRAIVDFADMDEREWKAPGAPTRPLGFAPFRTVWYHLSEVRNAFPGGTETLEQVSSGREPPAAGPARLVCPLPGARAFQTVLQIRLRQEPLGPVLLRLQVSCEGRVHERRPKVPRYGPAPLHVFRRLRGTVVAAGLLGPVPR